MRSINDAFEDYVAWATQLDDTDIGLSDDEDALAEEVRRDDIFSMLNELSPQEALASFMRVLFAAGLGACI